MMKPLTIGQLAARAAVGVETIRFYERRGLLDEPHRSASGYRHFGEDALARICFIRRAKELGFTLGEIKELLALRVDETACCAEVKRRAENKIADIQQKIQTLQKMKRALVKITNACSGQGKSTDCTILDALGRQ